jgi:hypothetical protein
MSSSTDPGFGAYLRTDPNLLAVYLETTGRVWSDSTRLLGVWREDSDSVARDSFSPAQVEQWLKEHTAADDNDLADCRICASIWMARY